MADQQQSNHQFLHENKDNEVDSVVTTMATTNRPIAKSLTNICYDCLERIFDYLDIESLLNVADTCKCL